MDTMIRRSVFARTSSFTRRRDSLENESLDALRHYPRLTSETP